METELIDSATAIVYGGEAKFEADAPATITTPDQESKTENRGLETGPVPAALLCALVAE
jgi:hypothetical protein